MNATPSNLLGYLAQLRNARGNRLGLTQLAILEVINAMPDRAYGTGIAAELSSKLGEEMPDPQVFVALKRLEKRGMIESADTEHNQTVTPSKRSRGRPRKLYSLTAVGRRALLGAAGYVIHENDPLQQSSHGDAHEGNEEAKGALAPTPVVG